MEKINKSWQENDQNLCTFCLVEYGKKKHEKYITFQNFPIFLHPKPLVRPIFLEEFHALVSVHCINYAQTDSSDVLM